MVEEESRQKARAALPAFLLIKSFQCLTESVIVLDIKLNGHFRVLRDGNGKKDKRVSKTSDVRDECRRVQSALRGSNDYKRS